MIGSAYAWSARKPLLVLAATRRAAAAAGIYARVHLPLNACRPFGHGRWIATRSSPGHAPQGHRGPSTIRLRRRC